MFLNEMQQADFDSTLITIAKAVRTYNDALIKNGYDEDTALGLTVEFQMYWFEVIFKGGKSDERGNR